MVDNPVKPASQFTRQGVGDITHDQLIYLQQVLKESSGIQIKEEQFFLLKSRVQTVLSKNGLRSANELVQLLRRGGMAGQARLDLINACTTNETYWFRDANQYADLEQTIFPELYDRKGNGRIRLWSAGCSSGQEAYSICITAKKYADKKRILGADRLSIIGTDLSTDVVQRAQTGLYTEKEVSRGVSADDLRRFFKRSGEGWQINPDLKQMTEFRKFNLLDSFIGLGRFDVIFCRNVLIYFSDDLKTQILRKFYDALEPHGYLFLSSTESLGGAGDYFQVHGKSSHRFYIKK